MASNFFKSSSGVSLIPQTSTPSNPANGDIYYDNVLAKFRVYENGAWTDMVGAGSSGTPTPVYENFYTEGNGEDAVIGDFSTGNNTSFDGGGTLAGTFSLSTTGADLINGLVTKKYVQSATAGDNDDDYIASPSIPIPPGYRGRLLALSLQYRTDATSGNIKFVIFDDTNNVVLSDPLDTLDTFDNDFAAQYQVAFFCPADCEAIKVGPQVITGEANAYLLWDDVKVSDDVAPIKNVNEMTDPVAYTPVFTGWGTVTNINFTWARIGRYVQILGRFTSGTTTAVEHRISLPSGLTTADSSILSSTLKSVGILNFASLTASSGYILAEPSVSYLTVSIQDVTTNGLTKYSTAGLPDGVAYTVNALVPISNWNASAEHVVTPARSNMSDWFDCGATTITATTTSPTKGTTIVDKVYARRNGQNMDVRIEYAQTVAGTAGSGDYLFAIPTSFGPYSGLTIDTSLLAEYTTVEGATTFNTTNSVGSAAMGGTSLSGIATISVYDTTRVRALIVGDGIQGAFSSGLYALSVATINFTAEFSVPITGWTSDAVFLAAVPIPLTVYLKDVKASGTHGGTFTSGAWQTRTLNTVSGSSAIVSLSANQFTLQPGTYDISASAQSYIVNENKIKLRDITNSVDSIIGSSVRSVSSAANTSNSILGDIITITSATTFELQHRCTTTRATDGFGPASSFGVSEVYAQVKITKIK